MASDKHTGVHNTARPSRKEEGILSERPCLALDLSKCDRSFIKRPSVEIKKAFFCYAAQHPRRSTILLQLQ